MTTHDIRQIHDSPRMARIENSSQPTSSRKWFDEHIMATRQLATRQSAISSTPSRRYSHYHQQEFWQERGTGLTIIIDNQPIIMIINRTNRFIIIIPLVAIKIFSLSSMARANRQSLLKSPLFKKAGDVGTY